MHKLYTRDPGLKIFEVDNILLKSRANKALLPSSVIPIPSKCEMILFLVLKTCEA